VYFTGDILVEIDQLELLCRHSKIRSRGTTQYQEKVTLSGKRCPDCGVMVMYYGCMLTFVFFSLHYFRLH